MGNLQAILAMIKKNKPRDLQDRTPDTILTIDACEQGWGMTLENNKMEIMDAGQWKGSWHLKSSN
jgi:hypothetical protein